MHQELVLYENLLPPSQIGDVPPKKDVERSLSDESGASQALTSELAMSFLKSTNDFTDLHSMQRIVRTTTAKVMSNHYNRIHN